MKIKDRRQMLTFGAIALVALFAADKVIFTPLGHAWTDRSKRTEELRKKVAAGKQLVRREESLRSKWGQMQTNTLPNNPSLAEQIVLKAFDKWSKDSGMSISSMSSQWKHDGEDYMTLLCRVEGSGNMDTVSKFLYALEKSPTALKLENVEISAHDAEGQQLTLGLQVSGLVLGTQEQK